MSKPKYVIVSGFFSSGSSAAVDLLKEYKGAYECQAEIKIIEDPYGIRQLEWALTDGWDLLTSAAAIRDFRWLCHICSRRKTRFPFAPAGLGYKTTINPKFEKITDEYIEELSVYKYRSDFYYQKFKKTYIRYILDRCRFGLEYYSNGMLKTANRNMKECYFARPTKEQFFAATQHYFNKLYEPAFHEGVEFVILDQAISTLYADSVDKLFENAKMIIVDRDPRDMYIEDVVRWKENLDTDTRTRDAGRRYSIRYKALHQSQNQSDKVMKISFEKLIYQYSETVKQIEDFLEFTSEDHVAPNIYLKPDVSSKNIGLWKKYYSEYQEVIDTIKEELRDYCSEYAE